MVRNLLHRAPRVEEVLAADAMDITELRKAIENVLAETDILVAIHVLNEMSVDLARQLHGVRMKVTIEPKGV